MPSYNPPRYLFRRYEILRRAIPGNAFLEIGTGNIKLAQELLRYFKKGTIVDFSKYVQTFYERLPQIQRDKLTLKIGDVQALDLGGGFDCVVSCEVMEHIEDDSAFLQRIHSLLKEEGQLMLSVPSRMKYWSVHDEIVGHLRRYEKQELLALLQATGFKQVEVLSYGFPFINLLRIPRILLARKQHRYKKDWEQRQQTEVSGAKHASRSFDWLGLLVNPVTWLPLTWVASWFNRFDLSDGYLVVARK